MDTWHVAAIIAGVLMLYAMTLYACWKWKRAEQKTEKAMAISLALMQYMDINGLPPPAGDDPCFKRILNDMDEVICVCEKKIIQPDE